MDRLERILPEKNEPLFKRIVLKILNIVVLVVLVAITAAVVLTLGLSSYHPG